MHEVEVVLSVHVYHVAGRPSVAVALLLRPEADGPHVVAAVDG
eukprot:SAG22_NODE_5216_length_1060_cov_1.087409_2_plen_42_part_01